MQILPHLRLRMAFLWRSFGKAPARNQETQEQVLEKLETLVGAPQFLSTLETVKNEPAVTTAVQPAPVKVHLGPDGRSLDFEVAEECNQVQDYSEGPELGWLVTGAPESDYVLVEQRDAVEALAYYIAIYINRFPEARKMEPKQLQKALSSAFKVVRRGKFKQVWEWGRRVYRWSALGYSALQMYQNPWLIQAVLTALWTFSRLSIKALC